MVHHENVGPHYISEMVRSEMVMLGTIEHSDFDIDW